jgi:hypothetical protein
MIAILHSAPRFWQAVAYKPLQHLTLAMKMRDRELYYDAFQHAAAHAYYQLDGVTWQAISAITGVHGNTQQIIYNGQFDNMRLSAENLKNDLHRLETGAGQVQRPQRRRNNWSFFGITIAGPSYDAKADAQEQYTLIARSIFGQWLAEHLYVQKPGLSGPRYRSEDINVDLLAPHDAPALRFNLAVHRLEQAALSNDPTSIFGLFTARRFAAKCSLFKRKEAEEGIKEALLDIIKHAGYAIERFRNLDLTSVTVDRAEHNYYWGIIIGLMRHRVYPGRPLTHITGGAHFDGHYVGYFTCLKVNALVPFDTRVEACAVSKCEPLDCQTLLASQQWMDRVFEPIDETRQPFLLSTRITLRSIIDHLKLLGFVAFLVVIGRFLLVV